MSVVKLPIVDTRIDDDAYYGLAGEIVKTIEPHTESDPIALLLQLLSAVGNAIGPSPYLMLEADRHKPKLFCVIVGDTAKARKGTGLGWVKKIVNMADPDWQRRCVSGLSSGEGVVHHVRDPADDDEHAIDRRLMVIESEFGAVLKVADRHGSILSSTVRDAWDDITLRTLNKNNPVISTNSHISIIGHITNDELRHLLCQSDMSNGFGNRFLWACVKRSKLLPLGGSLRDDDLIPLAQYLREAMMAARKGGRVTLDGEAINAWSAIYHSMAAKPPGGLIGAMCCRMETQLLRVAMIYALIDGGTVIRVKHLDAARALTNYCTKSVREIFASHTGNHVADTILREVRAVGRLNRTQVRDLGAGHWSRGQIDEAIDILVTDHNVATIHEDTGGRRKTVIVDMRPTPIRGD